MAACTSVHELLLLGISAVRPDACANLSFSRASCVKATLSHTCRSLLCTFCSALSAYLPQGCPFDTG